jgi:hypothetical protein
MTLIDQGLKTLDICSREGREFQLIDQLRQILSTGNQLIERPQLCLDLLVGVLVMEASGLHQ